MEYIAFVKDIGSNFRYFLKWGIFAAVMGVLGGLVGASFVKLISFVTGIRTVHTWLLYCMPLSGLVIVLLYGLCKQKGNKGTNTVIEFVHSGVHINGTLAPLVYVSTGLSHLVGASVGREGAALQIGGSMGEALAKLMRLEDSDSRTAVMAGMSGMFAAVFGTPVAAAVFPIEVVSVGIMQFSALVPCIFSSFIGYGVSVCLGTSFESFEVLSIPELSVKPVIYIIILGILSGLLAQVFCNMLHASGDIFGKIKNYYLRIVAASAIFIVLTKLEGSNLYLGASSKFLEEALEGNAPMFGFFFKMLFTSIALGGRFKGGEIVPTFCVGAGFGAVFGTLLGFSPSLCAACGMSALFVGVTNCPISTLIISLEMMSPEAMPYFSIAIAVSYIFSGYSSLYHEQRFMYSKTKNKYIFNKPKEGPAKREDSLG